MSLARQFFTTAYGLIASSLSGTILGVVALIIAARIYPAADLGHGAAAIALASLAGTIGSAGLGNGLMRFLPVAGSRSTALVASAYALVIALSVGVALAVWLWSVSRNQPSAVYAGLAGLLLFLIGAGAKGATLIQDGILVSEARSTALVARVMVEGAIRIVTVILFAPAAVLGYVASWAGSIAVPVMMFARAGRTKHPSGTDPLTLFRLRDVLAFSGANHALDVLGALGPALVPTIVVGLSGGTEGAFFAVPYMGAALVQSIGRAASVSLFAVAARPDTDARLALTRALVFGVGQVVPIVLVAWLLAEPALSLVGLDYEANAAWPLRILVLAALPHAIASPGLALRRVQGRFQGPLIIAAINAGVSVGTALMMVPTYGALGGAYAILAGHAVSAALVSVAYLRAWRASP